MHYKFDHFGWFAGTSPTATDRSTQLVPDTLGAPLVDAPYPNFTGYAWIMQAYVVPAILPIVVVPQSVTKRQAYQQLAIVGKLTSVLPALNAIPNPLQRELAIIEFQESQTFERTRPLVITMGAVLGLDLDSLFIEANKL